MSFFEQETAFTFDDFLLVPQYSQIRSRSSVDLYVKPREGFSFELPIITSPMDTVTNAEVVAAVTEAGGLGIIHRGQSIEEQVKQIKLVRGFCPAKDGWHVGAAIGVKAADYTRAYAAWAAGADVLCIDVSHGDHATVLNFTEEIRKNFPEVLLISGNVATADATAALVDRGADMVRVGIGNGSICSTRLQCGHGVPQGTALLNSHRKMINQGRHAPILISDGGCKHAGDIAKALSCGAGMVMLGSMLSGCHESPGETVTRDGKYFKVYRGMASEEAQSDWSGSVKSIEGISSLVPIKGTITEVVQKIKHNLQAALSYSGAYNIREFREKAKRIQISTASQIEGQTHILLKGERM